MYVFKYSVHVIYICIQFEIAIFLFLSVKLLKNINWFEAGS